MINDQLKICSLIFLIGFLSACASIAPHPSSNLPPLQKLTWLEREKMLAGVERWHINGKIAVQTSQDSGSATVDWLRQGGYYSISLYGPFGSNALTLKGRPGLVTMRDANGKQFAGRSPEELLGKLWGYHVPISNLNYWVRGLPVPGIDARKQFDAENRLVALFQGGWRVQFLSYMRVGNLEMPSKIFITSPMLRTKLIIYQWEAR